MLTVSPPVSPSVVARVLMIQKPKVIAGTLLSASPISRRSFIPSVPRCSSVFLGAALNQRVAPHKGGIR